MNHKLILFDFDGVVIDGINEYWFSSLIACKKFLNTKEIPVDLNIHRPVSQEFIHLRPWVKFGWEMVIITHEIVKENTTLDSLGAENFTKNYYHNCQEILKKNSWAAEIVQKSLDDSRQFQLSTNPNKWISMHKPFSEVLSFMRQAKQNGFKIGIISTKGIEFTTQVINSFNIFPELIFGYESGSKTQIISALKLDYKIVGFIEDRRQTLINIVNNKFTANIPCFLANWGYLKDTDRLDLPSKIKLLKLKDLKDILANSF